MTINNMNIYELFNLDPDKTALMSDEELGAIILPHFINIHPAQPAQKEMFSTEAIIASAGTNKKPKKSTAEMIADNQAMLARIEAMRKKK